MTVLDRIKEIESPDISGWSEDAQWRADNREWLKISTQISIKILRAIHSIGITKEVLAERMGVSNEYINKIVKGQDNLDLKTIFKLEKALGISLFYIPHIIIEDHKKNKG